MLSREFEANLPGGGGQLVAHCSCGRVHFATADRFGGYEPGELEALRAKAKENPKKYLEDGQQDSIGTYSIDGVNVVWGCPCRQFERMEEFLVAGQRWIVAFYRERTQRLRKEAAAAAEELAGLEVGDG